MRADVTVREARVEDSSGLARVQVDSYRTAYAPWLPADYLAQFSDEEQTQDWRDLILAAAGDVLYVAVLPGGEVVGYALARACGREPGARFDAELVALHVRRPDQREGIGGGLVAAVAARLRQDGRHSLVLWTMAANPIRAWYERLGGQLCGEETHDVGGALVSEVAYGWPDIDVL